MNLIVSTEVICPNCGETFPLSIDTSQSEQTLVEDCSVCCRPISLSVQSSPGEVEHLEIVS